MFSLDEQIRRSILLLEHEWNKKNILNFIELEKIEYLGDEELLEQVWLNLIGNAIKFSNINGKISIRLNQTVNAVIVTVSDNSMGMRDETITRIFEKFYKGDQTHSYEGSGLGLSLVKSILDFLLSRRRRLHAARHLSNSLFLFKVYLPPVPGISELTVQHLMGRSSKSTCNCFILPLYNYNFHTKTRLSGL